MTGLGGNEGAYFVLAGFAVLVAVLLALRLRRRAPDGLRPGTFGPPGADMKAELEHLLAEIRDAAREEIARLDTQMRMLRQLLAECDRKVKEMEALLGRQGAGTAAASPPPPARPSNPLHDQVYALLDAGKDLREIGAATGLEKGEIELILGLRRVPPAK